jgi:hypothetical protein
LGCSGRFKTGRRNLYLKILDTSRAPVGPLLDEELACSSYEFDFFLQILDYTFFTIANYSIKLPVLQGSPPNRRELQLGPKII